MTNFLILLLAMFVPQLGATFPDAMASNQAADYGFTKGHEYNSNGRFTYIIQIPPNRIESFTAGIAGSELKVQIDEIHQGSVEEVSIRFGTSVLPQEPLKTNPLRKQALKQPTIQQLTRYTPQLGSITPDQVPATLGGWDYDIETNRIAYIVQIPPETLARFSVGPNGEPPQAMTLPIDQRVRPYIQQFTVRIGSEVLPQKDPRDLDLSLTSTPIHTLGNRGMANIDFTPTNGQANLNSNAPQNSVLPNAPPSTNRLATTSNSSSDRSNNGLRDAISSRPNSAYSSSDPPALGAGRATAADLRNNPTNPPVIPNSPTGVSPQASTIFNHITGSQTNPNGQHLTNTVPNQGYSGPVTQGYVSDPRMAQPHVPYAPLSTTDPGRFASIPNGPSAYLGTTTSTATQNSPAPVPVTLQPVSTGMIPTTTVSQHASEMLDQMGRWFRTSLLFVIVLLGLNIFQFFVVAKAKTRIRQMIINRRGTQLETSNMA